MTATMRHHHCGGQRAATATATVVVVLLNLMTGPYTTGFLADDTKLAATVGSGTGRTAPVATTPAPTPPRFTPGPSDVRPSPRPLPSHDAD